MYVICKYKVPHKKTGNFRFTLCILHVFYHVFYHILLLLELKKKELENLYVNVFSSLIT